MYLHKVRFMITVISGTNRKDSKTAMVAKYCYDQLKGKTTEAVHFIDLAEIPHDWFFPDMYDAKNQAASLAKLQDESIFPAQKFLVVSPEYNGGLAGVLKLFIDAVSIREYAANFKEKKAALIGVASGRAGNLRGCDQLAAILNHVGTVVLPNKLPISQIGAVSDENGINNEGTMAVI